MKKAKERNIKIGCLLSILAAYVVIYYTLILRHFLAYSEAINASVLLLIAFISYQFFGFQKDKTNELKKNVLIIIVVQVVIYFLFIYLLGLFTGFLKNSYSLSLQGILSNTVAPIVLIIAGELFRYIVVTNTKSKILKVLMTIILTITDCMIRIRLSLLIHAATGFKIATSVIMPAIFKHFTMTYLTEKVGYKPGLVYRLVLDLYFYLLPIFPDFSDYINAMLGICLPFLVYISSSRLIEEYENGVEHIFKKDALEWQDAPLITVVLILAALISGYFPLYLLGVSTGSMEPTIDIGDAVLSKKVHSIDEIKEGDVIVYKDDGLLIVHRINRIVEEDGETVIKTKGDANNVEDEIDLSIEDIHGKVLLTIPYIAIPSIYIHNLIN